MVESKQVSITHFSDVLCVWAYLSQIRMDELQEKFAERINVSYHFIQIFGSVESKMQQNWSHRGGVDAYNKMVCELGSAFKHIEIHPDIWKKQQPTSSASCHLFIKAVQLLELQNELPVTGKGTGLSERLAWEMRVAFFRDLVDVSALPAQLAIAEKLGLPVAKIEAQIFSGAAFAALDLDQQLKEKYRVVGSPTLVFNEGRQIIYGNVGYRVIEANINELLNECSTLASWC